jgi:hypothetical protein
MQLNPDLHHRYALDRQERLLADATAHRLVAPTPVRARIAGALRGAADRLDAALPCGPAERAALAERC